MARKMKTMDGNAAAAYVSYAFTEVAAIYPITPSTPMAENVDEWAAQGKKNLFGQPVRMVEMQSEAGAAAAVHGALQAGALTTTYTASQGLLLMIPNLYKIAGELLPAVFHVSARALATSSLNIFGDHQDVMAVRQTGCAMLAESSVQQVMDLSAVAHLAAIKGRVPFINFFDGFRTSHEIQKIELLEYDELDRLLDREAVDRFRRRALHPDHPVARGTAQNPDIYFQERESVNRFYQALPELVEETMAHISRLTGREYHLFNYHGAPDAERLIIAMGSVCETIAETVDYLNQRGEKVGLLTVHLYRPFSLTHFFSAIPPTVQRIAVLDRTKEPGAQAEPLYLDVKNAFYNHDARPLIVGGRYALGGKDIAPVHIAAVFHNLLHPMPQDGFTVGIVDDVTHCSLPLPVDDIDTAPEGTTACKFWGLGSDGTVGANKSAIKIIGDQTPMYAQAYFSYDSKKSGGITVSHLRFGTRPITSPYLIRNADFIACSQQSYVEKYDLLAGLKPGGTFLLNCTWSPATLEDALPAAMKRYLAHNQIRFYVVNAVDIAQQLGLGGRFNMIMQAAFFKLTGIIPVETAADYLKSAVAHAYGKKGQHVVTMNQAAIDQGMLAPVQVTIPAHWANLPEPTVVAAALPEFIRRILTPMNRQEGDALPVSAFSGMEDGTFPLGTAAFEKRGIAISVPAWQPEGCTQCNQCAFICPHAAIRPALLTDEERTQAPDTLLSKPATGAKTLHYHLAVSPLDCSGCGNCVDICPSRGKSLTMQPLASQQPKIALWEQVLGLPPKSNPFSKTTVKGSQFETPLLEFSGACAGCGETPYARLVTQLFGDRMLIANATGCSSIWGASAPSIPYAANHRGHGPAWANSLFEDNAEFGLGMLLGGNAIREQLAGDAATALMQPLSPALADALNLWLELKERGDGTRERADRLIALLEREKGDHPLLNRLYQNRDYLAKRSQWIFGGDGWAYDIGFGGLDHVLASGEDINVLVFDTEVYSNTGGQSSKSTPAAAMAKFAAEGKRTRKKDLGLMAMSYGYVYVAQVAMGADKAQTLRAIAEAEAHPGPSLIIAYAACINHGLKAGMGCSQRETKKAVESGYWNLYRFNPQLQAAGKNPFTLDSDEPEADFQDFLMGEVRYSALQRQYPELASQLFAKTEQDARERFERYKRLAEG
ncbi:pyruvate:ferredoxin (flavodoxin) oxidoreductase [Dickeya dianthicola]|uniref:pyruvate:ferredoxin (flavodoxin) oxidoreductase n=1 Tax=Dickeya dianthicola TaxID=204039 RepID=UPI0003A3A84E|nr:pyruvate:ferredoxin (flavodoxin) oxidoreductase [Dickeya dianthicola]MCI4030402.1 pyruvate:ferredoxin (flavodoxin) oxidoreductase [Dickeya dianthicola]MCI4172281.1 pyruvate:ferredoxin (flavodoxin) oxidoreductase [Dickeya dianthicola]MCI4177249.1 pyruvate:ferredoxin (flavodoxin) oxidoreductase [Dickeya dianthicola]MCI4181092.1 pyruvate:ferredoxin (flavodoxin) oxidoreductase [Dickeya dianthicola]MCI4196475.1 pyruvate:ferredoxin (flavodoxin) oxidoreductase [Dickeya dianthicola]